MSRAVLLKLPCPRIPRFLRYYRPEDTKGGRQPWHGADEIIESDHKDTYHVRCVNSMAKVLGVDEYISRRQAQALEIGSGVSARKKPALKETITTSDGVCKLVVFFFSFFSSFWLSSSRSTFPRYPVDLGKRKTKRNVHLC